MDDVLSNLKVLKELDAQRVIFRHDKQKAIDEVLTDGIKLLLADIDSEFETEDAAIRKAIKKTEAEIKAGVIACGQTVKGDYTAVYNKGRISWNTKGLEGYAVAHPEIETLKKVGKPSVSIRRK